MAQIRAWQLLMTEFQVNSVCPPWLSSVIPCSKKCKARILKKRFKKALETTGVTLQISGLNPQLLINPKLQVWVDKNANIHVAVDYDNQNFDFLYASDQFIAQNADRATSARCIEQLSQQDPTTRWRVHVLADFTQWCEQQLFNRRSLVLYACTDHSSPGDSQLTSNSTNNWTAATTWARLCNEPEHHVQACVGVFPLWRQALAQNSSLLGA